MLEVIDAVANFVLNFFYLDVAEVFKSFLQIPRHSNKPFFFICILLCLENLSYIEATLKRNFRELISWLRPKIILIERLSHQSRRWRLSLEYIFCWYFTASKAHWTIIPSQPLIFIIFTAPLRLLILHCHRHNSTERGSNEAWFYRLVRKMLLVHRMKASEIFPLNWDSLVELYPLILRHLI